MCLFFLGLKKRAGIASPLLCFIFVFLLTTQATAETLVIQNYRAEIPNHSIDSESSVLIIVEGALSAELAHLTRKYLAHDVIARVDQQEVFRGMMQTIIEDGKFRMTAPDPQPKPEFVEAIKKLIQGQAKLELIFE